MKSAFVRALVVCVIIASILFVFSGCAKKQADVQDQPAEEQVDETADEAAEDTGEAVEAEEAEEGGEEEAAEEGGEQAE